MKESKPLVVRYCPYKSLPYHRSGERRLHRKPVFKCTSKSKQCNLNYSQVKNVPIESSDRKEKDQSFSSDLISETLRAIGDLYPTNTNTRVHWDIPSTLQPHTSHPLHNVTLVTTPKHSQDDLSDVLEEVLDLWTALQKSNSYHGTSEVSHGSSESFPSTAGLNEE